MLNLMTILPPHRKGALRPGCYWGSHFRLVCTTALALEAAICIAMGKSPSLSFNEKQVSAELWE